MTAVVRSGGVVMPKAQDWQQGTVQLRRAFQNYDREFVMETIDDAGE